MSTRSSSGQRLYQQVVDKILPMLDSGIYPPGTRLPSERELSETFEVSRPTIREAVIALEVMGRVSVKTGSGVYVLDPPTIKGRAEEFSPFELTEARILLEGEAASLAASMMSEEQLGRLNEAFGEMVKENEQGNLSSEVADRRFHTVISEGTHNRVLMSSIEMLWDIQARSPQIHSAHKSVCVKDGQRRLDEHRAILDAIKGREPNQARMAMRNHFARMVEALHDETEAEAVAEVKRKINERRQRFSLDLLNEGTS